MDKRAFKVSGKQENPILEAWIRHPEWRSDFIRFLAGRYRSLFERLEEKNIKVGLTDPD